MKIKKAKFRILLLALILVFSVSSSMTALAAGTTSTFEVGGFIQPPSKPIDYNTNTNWANIKAAGIDTMVFNSVPDLNINKADNETGIAYSTANNVKVLITDKNIYDKQCYTAADYAALNSVLTPYLNDSRVKGFTLKDEPVATDLEGFANSYKYIKQLNPNMQVYVNLYTNTTTIPGELCLSNSKAKENGSFVTSANSIGQTIKVPSGITYIDGIDMNIDMGQWASNEILTLKLWNSTSKTALLGQASITGNGLVGNGYNFPYFAVHASVTPGTTYYMELTHNGGGNNSVGWALRSNASVYADGVGYEAGAAKGYDFFFRMYTKRTNEGNIWQNFVDDWIKYSGTDHLLHDIYPFFGSSDNPDYFNVIEMVRGRGLANDVAYGNFLQSIEVKNSTGSYVKYRNPNLAMMRWNVNTNLVYGYKKLYWFTYWRPTPTVVWDEYYYNTPVDYDGTKLTKYTQIQTLDNEMHNLGNTLKNLTSRRVYHTGSSIPGGTTFMPADFFVKPANYNLPLIEGYFTDASGRSYIFIVNRDYVNSVTTNFYVSPKPATLTEISKSSGAEGSLVQGTYTSSTGIMNITLTAGEGRLFAMPSGYVPYRNLLATANVSATSSREYTRDGWALNRVNDDLRNSTQNSYGEKSFGWSSDSNVGANHTEAITFDMGSTKTVSEVDLFPRTDSGNVGAGFPINFTIKTSTDGTNWTTVVTKTGYGVPTKGQSFTFAAQTARYIKVEGTSLRQTPVELAYRMQFAEIEAYSTPNYALAATATATSSVEAWGQTLATINDGYRNSYATGIEWSSNNSLTTNHTESVTLDMGSNKTISEVDLCPRNESGSVGLWFPVNFNIKTSTDGTNWTTVVTRTGYVRPDHQLQSFTFTATSARYVKVEGTSLRPDGGEYRMQIAEVEIH